MSSSCVMSLRPTFESYECFLPLISPPNLARVSSQWSLRNEDYLTDKISFCGSKSLCISRLVNITRRCVSDFITQVSIADRSLRVWSAQGRKFRATRQCAERGRKASFRCDPYFYWVLLDLLRQNFWWTSQEATSCVCLFFYERERFTNRQRLNGQNFTGFYFRFITCFARLFAIIYPQEISTSVIHQSHETDWLVVLGHDAQESFHLLLASKSNWRT